MRFTILNINKSDTALTYFQTSRKQNFINIYIFELSFIDIFSVAALVTDTTQIFREGSDSKLRRDENLVSDREISFEVTSDVYVHAIKLIEKLKSDTALSHVPAKHQMTNRKRFFIVTSSDES